MIPISALVALVLPQQYPAAGEEFVFPRTASLMNTQGPLESTGGGGSRDFGIAVDALSSALRFGRSNVIASDPEKADRLQDLLDLLSKAQRSRGGVKVMPEAPLSERLHGFKMSRFIFSIEGRILALRFTVYSDFRQTTEYRQLRGYWKAFGPAKVFFAYGNTCSFKITGAEPSLFRRGGYRAFSDVNFARLPLRPSDGSLSYREGVLVQLYGLDRFGTVLPVAKGRKVDTVLKGMLNEVDLLFKEAHESPERLVEPVVIKLPPDLADIYVKESLRAPR